MGKTDLIIPSIFGITALWLVSKGKKGAEAAIDTVSLGARIGRKAKDIVDDFTDDFDLNGFDDIDTGNGTNGDLDFPGKGTIDDFSSTIEKMFKSITPATFIAIERPDAWWDIPAYTPLEPDYIQAGDAVDRWI